ncbi:MAG: hypothetical protein V3U52_06980 [Thermoplasmata archaeon]
MRGMMCCGSGMSVCHPMYGSAWGPRTKGEFAEDLEDYKERLELEIRNLERRIKTLREQASE